MSAMHPQEPPKVNECPRRWLGPGDHLWSVPNDRDEVECLFCRERRTLEVKGKVHAKA
jgi:hypothetical protein